MTLYQFNAADEMEQIEPFGVVCLWVNAMTVNLKLSVGR